MPNKGRSKSQVSVMPEPIPEQDPPPLDVLTVKIKSLRIPEETPTRFAISVTFYDQLILSGVIDSTPARAVIREQTVLSDTMNYDPSDYERMSIISGNPLCVQIQPLKVSSTMQGSASVISPPHSSQSKSSKSSKNSATRYPSLHDRNLHDISCCNIDILSLFIDKTKKHLKKRMQPLIEPSILFCKSWENLPLLNMTLEVTRNPQNKCHHKLLKQANCMKLTLIGAYNMFVPYSDEYVYTAASRLPLQNGMNLGLVTFGQGYRKPRTFSSLNFTPKWESLCVSDRTFTEGDEKFKVSLDEIQNEDDIFIERYLDKPTGTTIWGSFHRTLLLGNGESWLMKHIKQYHWPLEVHIYGETRGFSFMAFLNLFKLLYPGEDTVRISAPLQWVNSEVMQTKCGCELLLTPNDKASSTHTTKTMRTETAANLIRDTDPFIPSTGSDNSNAFVILEVKLAHPLKKVVIPPYIPPSELNEMLTQMEQKGPAKRECTGRGQQDRDWQTTVKNAAGALRKVPYYGTTEFCQFNRQLSETRTRVELTTSCWLDAAVYINNNFVVKDFLRSEEAFEEMLMMAHACLMKSASLMLFGTDNRRDIDPTLKAARHARQMQDISHATELYLQVITQKPRDASCWRELSTCLKDIDREWANVCINKSVVLDPRHPISLLSKGCMLYEEEPSLGEPFFEALLAMYPFWSVGWIIARAYYLQMEWFHLADRVLECNSSSFFVGKTEHLEPSRSWEGELGDWWDPTPLLAGMSPYYNAADLLLRLRCIKLAEVCVSLALCDGGATAAYYHLVALCCRLQGNIEDALCHCQAGIEKYGEISYLRTLEAECYHKLNDIPATTASFDKAGNFTSSYSILLSTPCRDLQRVSATLVDLSRRQPSAYVWMALADNWMAKAATTETLEAERLGQPPPDAAKDCAEMCAIQALKWDRRAKKAWALLAKLVKPSARRLHCKQMAWDILGLCVYWEHSCSPSKAPSCGGDVCRVTLFPQIWLRRVMAGTCVILVIGCCLRVAGLLLCGYRSDSEDKLDTTVESEQSLCHHLGNALMGCRCYLCEKTKM